MAAESKLCFIFCRNSTLWARYSWSTTAGKVILCYKSYNAVILRSDNLFLPDVFKYFKSLTT